MRLLLAATGAALLACLLAAPSALATFELGAPSLLAASLANQDLHQQQLSGLAATTTTGAAFVRPRQKPRQPSRSLRARKLAASNGALAAKPAAPEPLQLFGLFPEGLGQNRYAALERRDSDAAAAAATNLDEAAKTPPTEPQTEPPLDLSLGLSLGGAWGARSLAELDPNELNLNWPPAGSKRRSHKRKGGAKEKQRY